MQSAEHGCEPRTTQSNERHLKDDKTLLLGALQMTIDMKAVVKHVLIAGHFNPCMKQEVMGLQAGTGRISAVILSSVVEAYTIRNAALRILHQIADAYLVTGNDEIR
jgi:hypothetical protein